MNDTTTKATQTAPTEITFKAVRVFTGANAPRYAIRVLRSNDGQNLGYVQTASRSIRTFGSYVNAMRAAAAQTFADLDFMNAAQIAAAHRYNPELDLS